jgi:hypothetical protein
MSPRRHGTRNLCTPVCVCGMTRIKDGNSTHLQADRLLRKSAESAARQRLFCAPQPTDSTPASSLVSPRFHFILESSTLHTEICFSKPSPPPNPVLANVSLPWKCRKLTSHCVSHCLAVGNSVAQYSRFRYV